MKVSVKIEEDVKADLLKVAGEYQAIKGEVVTISDGIKQLIKEHNNLADFYNFLLDLEPSGNVSDDFQKVITEFVHSFPSTKGINYGKNHKK
jgi:hypothetical protein